MFTGQMPVVGVPATAVESHKPAIKIHSDWMAAIEPIIQNMISDKEHEIMTNKFCNGTAIIGLARSEDGVINPYGATEEGWRGTVIATFYDGELDESHMCRELNSDGTIDTNEDSEGDEVIFVYNEDDREGYWVNPKFFRACTKDEVLGDGFPKVGNWVRCEYTDYRHMNPDGDSRDVRDFFNIGQSYKIVEIDEDDKNFDILIANGDGEEWWSNMKYFSRATNW